MKTRGSYLLAAFLLASCAAITQAQNSYIQTNLVSDIPGLAANTDPNLVNPWGIASSSASPFWVSDNGTGLSTLYNTSGTPQALVVTIPPPPGSPVGTTGAPTGTVFNGTGSFNNDVFLFATEGGTIAGWRGALGTTAETLFNSATGAVYKGIALGTLSGNSYIYAADFHNGMVSVFPGTGAPPLSGNFSDPNLPSGYAPFNIQNINGNLYVTYALQDANKKDDVAGAGHGFVDVFDLNGVLLRRLITMGALNSPWGLALAPGNFGAFSNDLLVGNFGDGRINAFNPATRALLGTLNNLSGDPITIEGLWGLRFGNGGNGGNTNFLYFAAGIPGPTGEIEDHGLFGSLAAAPDSGSTFLLMLGAVAALACFVRSQRRIAEPG